MNISTYVSCFFVSVSIASGLVQASEVTLPYEDITLNASLELAPGKKPADGVILITHGGLAHRGMEMIAYIQSILKDKGYNTLAINLSLGLDNRHGMYDCKHTHRHRNDDAVDEIDAWIGWLTQQGAKRVILLGHSRGGAQTALYAAERDNALLHAVVLLAPATRDNTSAAAYWQRYSQPLAPLLEKAQKLVNDGKGRTVLEHANLLACADTPVTAESFVSYYAASARTDTPSLIPKIKKPTLVVIAGNDEVVIGLDNKLAPLTDGERVQMEVIDGAGHFFRDLNADDAVDMIDAFLQGVAYY